MKGLPNTSTHGQQRDWTPAVTHPSTNRARRCLTSVIWRELVTIRPCATRDCNSFCRFIILRSTFKFLIWARLKFQCYNFRVSVTSGVLFTYTSIIFCTFIFWLKGVSRNSPSENLTNINESIVLKIVHLIGHVSNTQGQFSIVLKLIHYEFQSQNPSMWRPVLYFPCLFIDVLLGFKHILLLSTKGLGAAKLRCKPSPNPWCIWLLHRWTKVCYWHVIWTFDLHKMINSLTG